MGVVRNVFGKNQNPPPSPNYPAAAQAQGQSNLETARVQTQLNRPTEVTPFGSRSWTNNGGDNWTSNEQLSPELQGLYNSGISNAGQAVSQPLDISKNRDALVDAMYQRQTRTLDPYYSQQEDAQKSDLINRGFSVGDKGYTTAMDNFQRNKDAAYANAREYSTTTGAQQAVQEALTQRQEPLQELSTIRGDSPNFQPYSTASGIQPAPTFAATQAGYQSDLDAANFRAQQRSGNLSGLFGLGASYLSGGGWPS